MNPKLHVVICSTRPGRSGPAIARWFHEAAASHRNFDIELVDLQEFALPVFDEPHHPRMQNYVHEHTRRWAASVAAADAFVFVTPEYNYAPPPSLLNALDYLAHEWAYKPVAFVSYGGIGAGVRAVQVAKQVVTTLRMVPILDAIPIPNFRTQLAADGRFVATDEQQKAVAPLVEELHRLAVALGPVRSHRPEDSTREKLLELEGRRCAALMAADIAGLESVVARDLVHVHTNAKVDDYPEYMDSVRNKLEFLEVKRGELHISIHGNFALMSGPQSIVVRRSGEKGEGRRIDSFVVQCWALRGSGWLQVSFQSTPSPQPAAVT